MFFGETTKITAKAEIRQRKKPSYAVGKQRKVRRSYFAANFLARIFGVSEVVENDRRTNGGYSTNLSYLFDRIFVPSSSDEERTDRK